MNEALSGFYKERLFIVWEFAPFHTLGGRKLKQVAWAFVNDR